MLKKIILFILFSFPLKLIRYKIVICKTGVQPTFYDSTTEMRVELKFYNAFNARPNLQVPYLL